MAGHAHLVVHCIVAQDVPTNGGAPPDLVWPRPTRRYATANTCKEASNSRLVLLSKQKSCVTSSRVQDVRLRYRSRLLSYQRGRITCVLLRNNNRVSTRKNQLLQNQLSSNVACTPTCKSLQLQISQFNSSSIL